MGTWCTEGVKRSMAQHLTEEHEKRQQLYYERSKEDRKLKHPNTARRVV